MAARSQVTSGDAVIAPSVTRRLLANLLPAPDSPPGGAVADAHVRALTPREREVMIEVARGRSNAEIAERLVLSEATVKTHVGRILQKLSLRDRVQVVVFAYEHGLVRAGERSGHVR